MAEETIYVGCSIAMLLCVDNADSSEMTLRKSIQGTRGGEGGEVALEELVVGSAKV